LTVLPAVTPEVDRELKATQKNRTVKPNGEAIARLRQGKLWRVEDLARKAHVSVKTVENVERGANVYMFTLAKFATAFDVKSASLIAGAELPVDPPKKERRIEVNLTVSIPYEEFDQSEQLVSLIESLKSVIQAANAVTPKAAMAGSTIITLEMSEADVHSLIAAFMAGKLDAMQVQELNLRLTHETPKSDSDADYLLDLDQAEARFSAHTPLTPPISDDVRIVEDTKTSKDAAEEEAPAEQDAKVPERKP
jgi:transcriptional regulator with XRE-family HTH domain